MTSQSDITIASVMRHDYISNYKDKKDLLVLLDENELIWLIEASLGFVSHKLKSISKEHKKYRLDFTSIHQAIA